MQDVGDIENKNIITEPENLADANNILSGPSPLVQRLSRYYKIPDEDITCLENMASRKINFSRGTDILARGAEMKDVLILISGWAIRCRYTPEGGRQIVHILVPGDLITPSVFVVRRTDHTITALSDVSVKFVEPNEMQRVFFEARSVAAAFWWAAEQEHGVLREQIVRLGRRSAFERVAHLLLELHRRLFLAGQAKEGMFVLPLNQSDIADTLGLSNVHINRTLKKLVASNHISYDGSLIQIVNPRLLAEVCDFDLAHFHLDSTIVTSKLTGML